MITTPQAVEAVGRFDLLPYFDKVSDQSRAELAEILVAMCNMPPNDPRERNGHGQQIPYVAPIERLRRFTRVLTTQVSAWPGPAGMIDLYNAMYTPADKFYKRSDGAGMIGDIPCDDIVTASGVLEAPAEQKYLPGPDDEDCSDLHAQIAELAGRKRLK